MEEQTHPVEINGRGSTAAWIVSFVLFPYGPFIYLAKLKAVTKTFAIFGVLASAAICLGLMSVLIRTNGEPWQQWVILIFGAAMYLLGMLQYLSGQRKAIWSDKGQKDWRLAGWFFGCVLLLGLLTQILLYQFSR